MRIVKKTLRRMLISCGTHYRLRTSWHSRLTISQASRKAVRRRTSSACVGEFRNVGEEGCQGGVLFPKYSISQAGTRCSRPFFTSHTHQLPVFVQADTRRCANVRLGLEPIASVPERGQHVGLGLRKGIKTGTGERGWSLVRVIFIEIGRKARLLSCACGVTWGNGEACRRKTNYHSSAQLCLPGQRLRCCQLWQPTS
jgi:hypothetical protein